MTYSATGAAVPDLPLVSRRRRWRGIVFGAGWLVFLVDPLSAAFDRHPQPSWRVLAVVLCVSFGANYAAIFPFAFRTERAVLTRCLLAGLCLQAVAFCLVAGEPGLFTLVYVGAAGAMVLGRGGLALGIGLAGAALAASAVVPGWTPSASEPFAVGMGTMAAFGFVQLLRANHDLREAQERIAQLAVSEERSRFSRDLHDILGHSLTVITVKSELAGRLVGASPERAAAEIGDVERLAREALADVRATVAGYRAMSLPAELSRARQALAAAGIVAELPAAVDEVIGERRDLFGWVIREGVTNVVRHSRARTCRVTVTADSVAVRDDGRGAAADFAAAPGHGLAGLRERVAAAGGILRAGPAAGGGFELSVAVRS